MASVLKVDTLTGVTTAGSIAVTGEGNSTTTNLQQGLAKGWYNFDGSLSSLSPRDSLNSSSLTDNGTGNYTNTLTNNMGNVNYIPSFSNGTHGDTRQFHVCVIDIDQNSSGNAPTTSAVRMQNNANGTTSANSVDHDHDFILGLIHGDLA